MKRNNWMLTFLIAFLTMSCANTNTYTTKSYSESEYKKISLNELISNSVKYDNKKVIIEGYFFFGMEESSISEKNKSKAQNSVWIKFNFFKKLIENKTNEELDGKRLSNYSGKKIIIKGTYDTKEKGHLGLYKGSIKDVVYFESGHVIYQANFTTEYNKWLRENNKGPNYDGHGKGDPSEAAAKKAERKL